MSSKKIKTSLEFLKKVFKTDDEAMEAIDFLQRKSMDMEFEEEPVSLVKGEFPLPKELENNSDAFAVFSDGACRGNPGPGAWGAMGQDATGKLIFESSGLDVPTTNNRMELEGAIQGLSQLLIHVEGADVEVFLYSDSKYVIDGLKSWMAGWKARGWKKADKKTPENVELWQQLDEVSQKFSKIHYYWVKGHSGHPQNEHCDQLANQALDEAGM